MGTMPYSKINWTYTDNLEEINSAMMNYVNRDDRFEGLANPDQIINIQWLPDRCCYVVYWRCY